jgi:hypothetical protein
MSWSVGASGLSDEVTVNVDAQFAAMHYPCPEPEETLKQQARALIAAYLASNKPPRDVTVSAFATQGSGWDGEKHVEPISNSLTITIT